MNANTYVGLATNKDSKNINNIYDNDRQLHNLIRGALFQANLGKIDPEIPFLDLVDPGMTILLKPNFVSHNNPSGCGLESLISQQNFVLSILKEVLLTKPSQIIIGDAPIQMTNWNAIVTQDFIHSIKKLCDKTKIEIVDFRQTIVHNRDLTNKIQKFTRNDNKYHLFDLKKDSLLDPISNFNHKFRIANYYYPKVNQMHQPGTHKYLICEEAFKADLILNIPKLKTHKKAGITGALKNIVGLIGDKEYLPHHRIGGTFEGGDCYYGYSPIKRLAEFFLDKANKNIGNSQYKKWRSVTDKFLNLQKKFGNTDIEGSWYGNDTIWRMVLDLNRILLYGRNDGSMADLPQRKILSITDAIICGVGEGPLSPQNQFIGAVTVSSSSPAADLVHSAVFNFNYKKIPLIRESFEKFRWPLIEDPNSIRIRMDNRYVTLKEVAHEIGINVPPPQGWIGNCEMEA